MAQTNLSSSSSLAATLATFDEMINRFGVVTVMNAKIINKPLQEICGVDKVETLKAHDILDKIKTFIQEDSGKGDGQHEVVTLDTLKIANITEEGPNKTITGGQYASPLLKYGKTATIEMQDALGNVDALSAFGGITVETFKVKGEMSNSATGKTKVIHITNQFAGEITIVGDSFFIDQKSGTQVPVNIILYKLLPDSIFNLTQDAEGDATVFDLNGSLLPQNITIGTDNTTAGNIIQGVFYSILPQNVQISDLQTEA